MKNKKGKKKILKAINFDLANLSAEEIKGLIDEETAKEADDIDMDYIDLCFRLLETKKNEEGQLKVRKPKGKKPIKTILIAAVLSLLLASSLTVFAMIKLDIPQSIAKLEDTNAQIDINLENADTSADGYALTETDLAKRLAEFGISPITIPQELTNGSCVIKSIENNTAEESLAKNANIEFEYAGSNAYLVISQFAQNFEFVGESTVMDVSAGKMINVNGMDVLVFEQKSGCSIEYRDGLTQYNIYVNTDFENAIKFAETIK